ncbi:methyltransferase [Ktedonospora formicarum]|uniref:Methyltransferase n=1 Tax=Ktedonospora formicarum TaxID=2778364 RepID=A0A8J3I7F8_9CHLR|nr:methyltransferase [Ktedonospora formicarum]GHO48503.1 methyltransferase [Ktedonospora formicarum]
MTETDDQTPAESANLSALSDLCTPWCIHVVATLRIADHIAAGITAIKTLADKAECNADFLQRVLRHLVCKGVFVEPTPGQFALNEAARGLLGPTQQFLDLGGIGGRIAYAWGSLLSAVRTGAPAYHEIFGLPFWEDLQAHPDVAASFDALMGSAGHSTPNPEVLLTGDWEEVKTVVDVGGGTGALLAEILCAHPQIQGTLVDFPGTVARAGSILQEAGVSERVRTVGQSFFDPLPAGGDLYLLKSILNDWPDREAQLILSRCAEAARPSGRLMILGGVLPDGSVNSLLTPEIVLLGGKDRTLNEFRELAHQAGLKVQAVGQLPSGCFAVECHPM